MMRRSDLAVPVSRTLPAPSARPARVQARIPFDARSVMLFATLSLGVALLAHAQPGPAAVRTPPAATAPSPAAATAFERADTDHDGLLSRSEAEALPTVAQYFDRIDTNRDGAVSLQELGDAVRG